MKEKPCPKCGDQAATYRLMMAECDKCVCKPAPESPDDLVEVRGMIIPRKYADQVR